jgi:hypothetical protein
LSGYDCIFKNGIWSNDTLAENIGCIIIIVIVIVINASNSTAAKLA